MLRYTTPRKYICNNNNKKWLVQDDVTVWEEKGKPWNRNSTKPANTKHRAIQYVLDAEYKTAANLLQRRDNVKHYKQKWFHQYIHCAELVVVGGREGGGGRDYICKTKI
jgi:hypothetical protein